MSDMHNTVYPEVGWMKERFQVLTLTEALFEFDWIMQPGAAVPLHLHKESDEHFLVLEGEVTFNLNGKTSLVKAGEELLIPRMTPHRISNKSGSPIKCRVSFRPVADQGKFFHILFFLAEQNPHDSNALFKAMYISDRVGYREFSTMQGGMRLAEKLMMVFFKLFAPLTGWNNLVKQYTQANFE